LEVESGWRQEKNNEL